MRSVVTARRDEHIAEFVNCRSHSLRFYLPTGELCAEKFEDEVFGKALQIRLRFFRLARTVLRDNAQQHVHCSLARRLQRAMNCASRFLRRESARSLKRWRQTRN